MIDRTLTASAIALTGLVACGPTPVATTEDRPVPAVDSSAVRPFVLGETRTLRSTILDQDRVINVSLPAGYSPDSATVYPVIYLLDGSADEDFVHVAGLVGFMSTYALIPPSIVVGIGNVDRRHDFTPTTQNDSDKVWVPNYGGSSDFIRYLAEELVPFVNSHYKVGSQRTLIGQSFGGLLATQLLIEKPELFDTWLLVSPSLWWNEGSMAVRAAEWTQAHRADPETVYIAMANNDDMMVPQVNTFVTSLKTTRSPFRWTHEDFPQETHATILHRAVYSGLEWVAKK